MRYNDIIKCVDIHQHYISINTAYREYGLPYYNRYTVFKRDPIYNLSDVYPDTYYMIDGFQPIYDGNNNYIRSARG